jgi:hypothetical protein
VGCTAVRCKERVTNRTQPTSFERKSKRTLVQCIGLRQGKAEAMGSQRIFSEPRRPHPNHCHCCWMERKNKGGGSHAEQTSERESECVLSERASERQWGSPGSRTAHHQNQREGWVCHRSE